MGRRTRKNSARIKFSHLLLATLQHPILYPRNPTKADTIQESSSRTRRGRRTRSQEECLAFSLDGQQGHRKKENGWQHVPTHRRTTSYYRIRINTDLRFRPRSSRGPGRTGRLRSSSMPEHPNPWRSQPPPFLRRRREVTLCRTALLGTVLNILAGAAAGRNPQEAAAAVCRQRRKGSPDRLGGIWRRTGMGVLFWFAAR